MFFNSPIEYDQPVFRPPSEGRSLLIQVTLGCSNNKCTYCDMYRSKSYSVRKIEDIKAELKKMALFYANQAPKKIFLCDGDALGAPMEVLLSTLEEINSLFPQLERVGIYATAEWIVGRRCRVKQSLRYERVGDAIVGQIVARCL